MKSFSVGCLGALVLVVGCAGATGGAGVDGNGGNGDASVDSAAIDAAPDAGPTVSTCEECEGNADCEPDHLCVLIGAVRACLPTCSAQNPDCPVGFTCGGVKTTFCAPSNGICCIDGDNDMFGVGVHCDGPDCDDTVGTTYPGARDNCNGVDDDCDSATVDGSGDLLLGDACDGPDVDLCNEGVLFCDIGALVCDDATTDNVDICNGVDDDCDPTTLDGAGDPAVGTACDSSDPDLCVDDVNICNSTAGQVECSDLPSGLAELCDGADNDCNVATPDGSADPAVGIPCDGLDLDLCQEGMTECVAASVVCTDNTGDNQEVCNGIDDDCNPATLDGVADPLIGQACDGNDSDMCLEGIMLCSSPLLVCNDNTSDTSELCNGIDDDCNAVTDDLNPDSVCPGQYPAAGNVTTWGCLGDCVISNCSAGFGDIDTLLGNGCECGGLDSLADSCAAASDTSVAVGATVDVSGKIETAAGSDWVRFTFIDVPPPGNYHPSVQLSDTGGGQFAMDVMSDCTNAQTCMAGGGVGVNTWEADWTYTAGAGCCSDVDGPHIGSVLVRVYRTNGDAPTCVSYTVRATNP